MQKADLESMYLNSQAKILDAAEREEIVGYLPDLKGKTVLDLGSGIGRFTRFFANHASRLISVDMTPQFVEKNRSKHADCQNVRFVCSDAMNFDVEQNSVDFIFLNWLFMYLEEGEVEILLERMDQWLKPKGEIFVRESCAARYVKNTEGDYHAHYRTLFDYDTMLKKRFWVVKEGHIQAHVDAFANPLQCFWHCRIR